MAADTRHSSNPGHRGPKKTTPRFKTLHIATGFRCNNACVFCCDSHGVRPPRPDLEVARRSLEENVELGFVVFTHLEPTLNTDLVTLVSWAKELGYETVMLVTNGRRLGKQGLAERLVEAGMNCVAISIHGHNAELHDKITQRKGSFAEVLAGVEAIRALRRLNDLEFKVLTTVTALNYGSLSEIANFVGDMGVDSHGMNAVYLEGEAARNVAAVAVSYEVMVEAFARAIQGTPQRDISLSEVPPCLTVGRLPARNIGFREAFHFPNLDEHGRLRESAKALPPAGRGFAFQPSCELCAMRSLCDGVPKAYIAHFGWAGLSPLTDSQCEALVVPEERETPLPFIPKAVLHDLLTPPAGEWTLASLKMNDKEALVELKVGAPHHLAVTLVLRPRNDAEPAYRRTRVFNVSLSGRGYRRKDEDLAKVAIRWLARRERSLGTSSPTTDQQLSAMRRK